MFKSKKSQVLFSEAEKVLVGGVNSPVRAFKAVGGHPLFIESANGAVLQDADGNRTIDFVGSWGPMILGHAHPAVNRAINRQVLKGISFGAPTELETRMGEIVTGAFPSIEKVRFVSSGTESAMTAVRLSRAFSKRDKIVKFAGCYHGHSDGLLVKAGSGAATLGIPDSGGVSVSVSKDTLVLPYNDPSALKACFRDFGNKIAAVILEPVAANMGLVLPEKGFLEAARDLTRERGSLLILDEVITGFRLSFGGAQTLYEIKPDLTCLGKIIGGGLPVGAVGGRAEIMDLLAPLGPVYQAGTLSGNPLAMAAGIATLTELKKHAPYPALEKRASSLAHFIRSRSKDLRIPTQVHQTGSLFTVFFSSEPVRDYGTAKKSDAGKYAVFFRELLLENVYFPPSQFETCFVSAAHTEAILAKSRRAISKALERTAHA